MAVASGDIHYRHSGAASAHAAQTDPNACLGSYCSSTQVTDNVDNNLFSDVPGVEHTAGEEYYRCIYVHNNNGATQLDSAVVWIASDTTGADSDISIAVGTAAVGGQEQSVADGKTAPTGVTWHDDWVSRATGGALGNIPAGSHKAVWIRMTVSAGSTPQAGDTCQIQAGGDTL